VPKTASVCSQQSVYRGWRVSDDDPRIVYDPASGSEANHRVICYRVRTEDELEEALVTARYWEAIVLIEFVMSRLDARDL